jgi:hypothetical protein
MVAIVLYRVNTGQSIPFFSSLPGFGNIKSTTEGFQEIRYDINQDKVQYFDGAWHDFKSDPQEVGNSDNKYSLTEEDLKKEFNKYYFSKDFRPSRDVYSDKTYSITIIYLATSDSSEAEAGNFWGIPGSYILEAPGVSIGNWWVGKSHPAYKRGDVVLTVSEGKQIEGFVYISSSGTYAFEAAGDNSDPFSANIAAQSAIISKAVAWRDSIFVNPIPLTYAVNKEDTAKSFCVNHFDNYLVIPNLSKPSTGASCTA